MLKKALISCIVAAATLSAGGGRVYAQFNMPVERAQPLYSQDTVTICICGDVMMHSQQIQNAGRGGSEYDFNSYFNLLKDRISKADIAIANMEFTLAGEPYAGYPCFSAPDSYAEYLADCGFDVFLTANNHIFDRGSQGAVRTLEKYRMLKESHGIEYCGLALNAQDRQRTYPLIINVKGITIALINFTYGTNLGTDRHWPKVNYLNETSRLKTALEESARADFCLVLPHWGTEYELMHSTRQRETAEWLVENGADMIVGTHPHVVQDCEEIKGVQVIYSLGNAVSNMSAENTQLELMSTIRLIRETNGDIKVMPAELTWLWCSRPGGYNNSYTVIPVEEHLEEKSRWKGAWEYDKMISTYKRVRNITGIK